MTRLIFFDLEVAGDDPKRHPVNNYRLYSRQELQKLRARMLRPSKAPTTKKAR